MEVTFKSKDEHIVYGSLYRTTIEKGFAILVHGVTADRHEWGFFDALTDYLNQKGITTLSIDYRGHGMSKMNFCDLSISGIFLDIEAAYKYMLKIKGNSEGKFILIGNSFGGGLGYLFGQLDNQINHIIMTCPVTSYVEDLNRVNPNWKKDLAKGYISYAGQKINGAIVREMFSYDKLIETCEPKVNTDIVHGLLDSDVPYKEAELFAHQRSSVLSIYGLEGMDHSFSAPEGTIDKDKISEKYRKLAAEYVSQLLK